MTEPGRTCPADYHYTLADLAEAEVVYGETLLIAGGLYGNEAALDRLLELKESEGAGCRLVFNGDFNWFNHHADSFDRVNSEVLSHAAIRGNVETELTRLDDDFGCGCAYPENVASDFVDRSNTILAVLKRTASGRPDLLARLGELPMALRVRVGSLSGVIVHGDLRSLAGWTFTPENLKKAAVQERTVNDLESLGVDFVASSHTCHPVACLLGLGPLSKIVINNGAAGMPNAPGVSGGIVTRVARQPSRGPVLWSANLNGVWIEAIEVAYDSARFMKKFMSQWPESSAAWVSYVERIRQGQSPA